MNTYLIILPLLSRIETELLLIRIVSVTWLGFKGFYKTINVEGAIHVDLV